MADPNIFAPFMRPVKSMAEYAADYDAAEQNALTLAAKRMDMQKMQRGEQTAEQRRRAFASSGGDGKAYRNALAALGDFEGVTAFDAQEQARLKAEADLGMVGANTKGKEAETQERLYRLAKQKDDDVNMALGALANDPGLSLEKVTGVLQGLVNSGRITPKYMEDALRNMPNDPNVIRGDLLLKVRKQLKPEELIKLYTPNIEYKDSGQQLIPVNTNPNSVGYVAPTPIQKLQTPDSVASNATSVENNIRSTEAQKEIAAAGRAQANATRDAAKITADSKRAQEAEMKLADDYRTESKGWAETATSIGMVKEALKTADKNPGSALAAGTKFMKLLDPTSVVRETELGMALNASGWFDRASNIANQLQSGRIMTKEQVKNLGAAADALYEEARKAQLQIDAAFESRAKAYGANPANVITDRGQRSPRNAPAPAAQDASGWSATKVN